LELGIGAIIAQIARGWKRTGDVCAEQVTAGAGRADSWVPGRPRKHLLGGESREIQKLELYLKWEMWAGSVARTLEVGYNGRRLGTAGGVWRKV
jgi:hypothetical protein